MKLLVALMLLCGPSEPKPFVAKGNTKRHFELQVEELKVQLSDNNGVVWSNNSRAFQVLFARDDSWVAMKGPDATGDIEIAPTTIDAAVFTVSPLEHLNEKEKSRVPKGNCGDAWFVDWASSPKGLKLTVAQTEGAKVILYVSADGTVSR
ncbi:MAG: hypothetical protein QM723_31370 [Myxococcaceae bacterium]